MNLDIEMMLKKHAKIKGFESVEEFKKFVGKGKKLSGKKKKLFERWQRIDGTKKGLLELL